jgi:folate-binding protein YgfZ
VIRLEGAGSRRFLHGQSSQAIELAPEGGCLASCLISPTARMRALALVRLEANAAELVVLAGDAQAVHQALDRVLFPADGVRLGPVQPAQLVRWIGTPTPSEADPAPQLLQPGVDLGAGTEQACWLHQPGDTLPSWLAALPELTNEQVEQRRLRSGFPAAPGELNDDTNPFELGLAPWVNLNKGCYVGQETLAKLATYDGVKQQVRYWRADRSGLPSDPAATGELTPGTSLTTAAGERAGVITSALHSSDGSEGLALVRRQALAEAELLAPGGQRLCISRPSGFVDPPVGAGGGR